MNNRKKSDALVAPSDVAEIAGVTRAAVSQWRKREKAPRFPDAIAGTDSRPLFDREAVLAWLKAEGKQINSVQTRVFWDAANAYRGWLDVDRFADMVLALSSIRVLSERNADGVWESWRRLIDLPLDELQRKAEQYDFDRRTSFEMPHVERMPGRGGRELIDLVSSIPLESLADACDFLLERAAAQQLHVSAFHGAVKSPAAQMLTALASGHLPSDGLLHDPAGGIGVVVTSVLEKAGNASAVAYEFETRTAQRAYQRAVVAGVDERFEIRNIDTLQNDAYPELKADVVAIEPPFGMRARLSPLDPRFPVKFPPTASDLAWVFHTVAHLKAGGRGFVLVPPGMLTSRTARQLRSVLLERGHVHQIIALPKRMVPHTAIALSLWVVGAEGSSSEVTFIDASGVDDASRAVPAWIQGEEIEAPHSTVPTAKVMAQDARLDPVNWVEWVPEFTRDELLAQANDAIGDLSANLRSLSEGGTKVGVPEIPEHLRVLSVDDLIRNGWVESVQARLGSKDRDEKPVNRVAGGQVNRYVLPTVPSFDEERATKPGDVLFTTIGQLKSAVDYEGGHVLGTDVHALRVAIDAPVTAEYLALALTGSWNARFTGGASSRVNLHDVEIPVPPHETQAALVELGESLAAMKERAARIAEGSEAAITHILDAVRQAG